MLELIPDRGMGFGRLPPICIVRSARDQPCELICLLPWSMLYFRLGSTITHTLRLGGVCRCWSQSSQIIIRLL